MDFNWLDIISTIIGASITTFFSILTWYLIERFRKKKQKKDLQLLFEDVKNIFDYLFSEQYRNEKNHKSHDDEKLISELHIIRTNVDDLRKYLTIELRKDEPSQVDKRISFLKGKYIVHFRIYSPFKSSIEFDGKFITELKETNNLLNNIYEEIRTNLKKRFKIKL